MTLKEAHAMYVEKYPTQSIGKSKFASHRPKRVMLTNDLSHNVCLCRYHENVQSFLDSVNKACAIFPTKCTELISTLTCDPTNHDCVYSICNDCGNLS